VFLSLSLSFSASLYISFYFTLPGVSSKQTFFFGSNRNKLKLDLFRLFLGLFRKNRNVFFRFVSVFRTGIETTNNRTFCETNRKNLYKKTHSIRVSWKQLIFFGSNRNKPKLNLFRLFFSMCGSQHPRKIFSVCFGVSDRYRFETTETRGIKKVYILTNLLLFRLVFSLFRLFQNNEIACFEIKAKQPKQTSFSDSAETSFGSSFGCFDKKLVRRTPYLGVSLSASVFLCHSLSLPLYLSFALVSHTQSMHT
jgi:hypothetical protein